MPCLQLDKNTILCYNHVFRIFNPRINRSWFFENGYFPNFCNKYGNPVKRPPWNGKAGKIAYWIMDNKDKLSNGERIIHEGYEIQAVN